MTYASSVSFRELKNAKKKYFFLNLGGVGAKTRFKSKKNWGRILGLAGKNIGSACLIYMGAEWWGGLGGVIMGKKQVGFKMHFKQYKVF